MSKISRHEMEKDKFVMPRDIVARAKKATKNFEKIAFTPIELLDLMAKADKALDGDSNDAEHDALYELREALSEAFEDPKRRTTMFAGGKDWKYKGA